MKFYIPLVVLTLCLRAVSGSTAIFEHHYISENPAWDFRVMRSVLVDIDKDGKSSLLSEADIFAIENMSMQNQDCLEKPLVISFQGNNFWMRHKLGSVVVADHVIMPIVTPEDESRQFGIIGFQFFDHIQAISRWI